MHVVIEAPKIHKNSFFQTYISIGKGAPLGCANVWGRHTLNLSYLLS